MYIVFAILFKISLKCVCKIESPLYVNLICGLPKAIYRTLHDKCIISTWRKSGIKYCVRTLQVYRIRSHKREKTGLAPHVITRTYVACSRRKIDVAGIDGGNGGIETRYSAERDGRGESRTCRVGSSCTWKPSTKDLSVTLGGYKTYVPLGEDRRGAIFLYLRRLSFHVGALKIIKQFCGGEKKQ
jgi:hypothetical protein